MYPLPHKKTHMSSWYYIPDFSFNLLMDFSDSLLKDSRLLILPYCLAKFIWLERCKELTADMRVRNSDVWLMVHYNTQTSPSPMKYLGGILLTNV